MLVAEALEDTRVVTLNGARQAGKSTLARLAAQGRPNSLIRLLDDPATLRAAQDDPASFVDHEPPSAPKTSPAYGTCTSASAPGSSPASSSTRASKPSPSATASAPSPSTPSGTQHHDPFPRARYAEILPPVVLFGRSKSLFCH